MKTSSSSDEPPWDYPRTISDAAMAVGSPILVPQGFGDGWVYEVHSESGQHPVGESSGTSAVTIRVSEPLEADFATRQQPSHVDLSSLVAAALIGHMMNRVSPVSDVPTVRALGTAASETPHALLLDGRHLPGTVVEFDEFEGAAALFEQTVYIVSGARGSCAVPLIRLR